MYRYNTDSTTRSSRQIYYNWYVTRLEIRKKRHLSRRMIFTSEIHCEKCCVHISNISAEIN